MVPLFFLMQRNSLIISDNKISNFFSTVSKESITKIVFVVKKADYTSMHVMYNNKVMIIKMFPSRCILVSETLKEFNYEYTVIQK